MNTKHLKIMDTKTMEKLKGISDLQSGMVEGIVTFSFIKKDGTIREAVGTLNVELITTIMKGKRFNRLQELAKKVVEGYNQKNVAELKEFFDRITKEDGNGKQRPEHLVQYFDIQKLAFRSFIKDNLVIK